MTATSFLHRQTEALEHLLTGYRTESESSYETPEQTAVGHFTIALSREAGTPAPEAAREIAERLGWPVYDREVPARIAQETHLPLAVVEEIDERRQSWLMECFEFFNSSCQLGESRYFRHLISVIRSLGDRGGCVIVGHGAEFILPPQSTLRVRLVGNRDDRIAALRRSLHLDRWAAARRLDEINRERSRFLHEHFHVDPTQPGNYDLILNTSLWSPSDCADFMLSALHHKAMGHLKS
ncbi:MAG: cytidylate kinase-like family protein [Gemmataceae bacterium]